MTTTADGRIEAIEVVRGAPCDATWIAAAQVVGVPVEEAADRFGLEVQLACKADPSSWDPIHGRSPVHFAGKVHRGAFEQALRRALTPRT